MMTDREIMRIFARRAFCYLKKGDIEKAIEDVTRAINGGKERLDLSIDSNKTFLAKFYETRAYLLLGLTEGGAAMIREAEKVLEGI